MSKAIPQGKWGMFKGKIKEISSDEVPFVGSIKEQRKALKKKKESRAEQQAQIDFMRTKRQWCGLPASRD